MGQIVSFEGYLPPARFDAISWTDADIEEATTPSGPWTMIDTISLGAADPDPANPVARDFTTDQGTAADLWYRVIFLDAALNTSEPTSAIHNAATATVSGAPCELWITGEEILDCCDTTVGSDVPVDTFAAEASALLFELSGRQFGGVCQRTVRPCPGHCGCWPGGIDPVLRYAGVTGIGWFDGSYWFGHGGRRGCRPLSSVKLAGFPVQEIVEVTIDGVVIDPSGYRLRRGRDLVRLNDVDGKRQRWPGCQDLGQTEGAGTFFVTYTYGVGPPVAGVEAAKQLACELVKACPVSGATEDCDLPPGTVRVTRQGMTVEAQTLGLFLGQGQTGLAHVDAFLAVYGTRARRPAVIWSPDVAPYAQEA